MERLTKREIAILKRLSTPIKIQNFLDRLPMNWEKKGDTHYSVRRVLRERKAHCIEGALVAAAALKLQGRPPLLMDLFPRTGTGDDAHVIALYKHGGYYGAVSKTNHATIRFRDPVYKTLRELALSYFHEWFMNTNGLKTLESYSRPLNLDRVNVDWLTSEEHLFELDDILDALHHYPLVPKGARARLRRADSMELAAGRLIEWRRADLRT